MHNLTRRAFMATSAAAACTALSPGCGAAEAVRRPNILWITCEDISPHLGCYGDAEAQTPNLDRLASEGTRYARAFPVAGVCAPSRSCLITGMYPITLGTCHMRCRHTPPEHVRCFPTYLRQAGYFCTNNVKTDYQFEVPPDAWDENSKTAHWRDRKDAKQPFFSVFNFTITHESQIGNLGALPAELAARIPGGPHDPARAVLPPFYPDTEVMRKHWAHLYDLISAMDVQAGDILKQLEEDGLAEDTIVFFFSDHGDGMPRAKRWMYDSGIHTPLIIRWPEKLKAGAVSERVVSFLDFAPTVLSAAGVAIPAHMQGKAFLGAAEGTPREYIFAGRDRMDERYDIIRATRDSRYKYIRNYEPYRPYTQYVSYNESWPIMQELRRVHAAGGMNAQQELFFRDTKPLEELFDTESDPFELINLIDSPEHVEILHRLRVQMDAWQDEAQDLGFVPETELEKWVPSVERPKTPGNRPQYPAPAEASAQVFGRPLSNWVEVLNGDDALPRFRAIAAIGLAGPAAIPTLRAALNDPETCVAYWAAVGLGNAGKADATTIALLTHALEHASLTVRLGAAAALAVQGCTDAALPVALRAMDHEDPIVRLFAVQILESIDEKPDHVVARLNLALEDSSDYVADVARHALGRRPQSAPNTPKTAPARKD